MPSKPKAVLERTLGRNTHRKCVLEVYRKHPGSQTVTNVRKSMRWYVAWMMSRLIVGERVQLPGLGTIYGTFRKGRSSHTNIHGRRVDNSQADTYCLKIRASGKLRKKLQELAAKQTDPQSVFKGNGKPLITDKPGAV